MRERIIIEQTLARDEIWGEMQLAKKIQTVLLPEAPLLSGFEIAVHMEPADDVGGDYYDVFPIPGGLYGIAIADVAGKGTAAALLMAALQSALHAITPGMSNKAGDTVQRLNTIMSRRMPDDKFITFFYGVLDPTDRTISYCCAGHDPPALLRSDGIVSSLSEGGLVLGVKGDALYRTTTMKMNADDRLLLYTDGITESMDKETGEEFGTGRLVDFLKEQDSLQSRNILENLLDRLEVFRGEVAALDDMTLLMITCTGYEVD